MSARVETLETFSYGDGDMANVCVMPDGQVRVTWTKEGRVWTVQFDAHLCQRLSCVLSNASAIAFSRRHS